MCLSFSGECGIAFFLECKLERIRVFSLTLKNHMASPCFTKANLPIMLSASLRVLSPPGPASLSGLRETLAFELLPHHRLLSENRQRRKEHWSTLLHWPKDLSIHLSIYPFVRLGERAHCQSQTAFVFKHGSKSYFVSKALFHSTVLQSKSPLASSVLLFSINNTRSLASKM